MKEELNELLRLADAIGQNAQLVQAGYGNASVKCTGRKVLITKAREYALKQMDKHNGWVALSIDQAMDVYNRNDIRALPRSRREKAVMDLLDNSVLELSRGHPAMELPMHLLLDRIAVYTNPIPVITASCHPDGKKIIDELNHRENQKPVLWVPYAAPGTPLIYLFEEHIHDYLQNHGFAPSVIIVQHHGLFCTGSDVDECLGVLNRFVESLSEYFGPVHPVDRQPPVDEESRRIVSSAIRKASYRTHTGPFLVRFSEEPELLYAPRNKSQQVFASALSPAHIIHNGPGAVFIGRDDGEEKITGELINFHQQYGMFPRVIILEGKGVCIVGYTAHELDLGEQLALAAVQAVLLAKIPLEGIDPREVEYIINWQSEQHRTHQMAAQG
ncbi:MAG: class II aldolase/adducin family protein [Chitinivibrionales bacterium]